MLKTKKDSGQANSRPDGAAGMTTSMLSTGKPEEAKYIKGDTCLSLLGIISREKKKEFPEEKLDF